MSSRPARPAAWRHFALESRGSRSAMVFESRSSAADILKRALKAIQSDLSFVDPSAKEVIMSGQSTQQKMPDASARKMVPDRLAHIVFKTADKSSLMDWYGRVLNAHVVFQNDFIAFLTYDNEHHRIAFIPIPGLET